MEGERKRSRYNNRGAMRSTSILDTQESWTSREFFFYNRDIFLVLRKRKCFFVFLSSFFSKVGMRSVEGERGLVWGISCHFHLPHVAYVCRVLVIGNFRLLLLMLLVWQLAPGFVHAFRFRFLEYGSRV